MNISANITSNTIPDWVYVEQVVYSGIIALIGIPGNILIILVFAYSQEKTTTDYMVFSMAISDLLGSAVCTTLNILAHIPALWANIGSTWFCRAHDFFAVFAGVISSWILGVVAFDRYLKICRPFSEMLTVSRIKAFCFIVFIIVTIFCAPSFAVDRFDHSSGTCLIIENKFMWTISIYVISFFSGLSYIVTAFAYTRVALALCTRLQMKHKRKHGTEESKAVINKSNSTTSTEIVEISSISITANASQVPHNDAIDTEKQISAVGSYSSGNISTGRHKNGLLQEQKKVNQTTLIMFMITIMNITIFIFVYVGNELAENNLYLPNGASEILGHIIRTTYMYMMSYIANPLLYIMMSSKFRENVKKLCHRRGKW